MVPGGCEGGHDIFVSLPHQKSLEYLNPLFGAMWLNVSWEVVRLTQRTTNSNRSKHNGTVWEISLLGRTIHKVRDGKIPVWHALHLCEDDCASFSNTAGSSDRTNLSYFKTTPTTTLKTTVQTSPHRALLGVGCPSGVVNVSPPLHDFFHRACSIKKPSKLHPDPFSILSFSIYFLFLSFFISTPVPHCQHVHTETPNPLIGTNGIPA